MRQNTSADFDINGKKVRITIPAGVYDGQQIKLKGHGNPGVNGGPSGDLYITFNIPIDPDFERIGDDLKTKVKIDLYTAVLGGDVKVNTLDGSVSLKVKPETQRAYRKTERKRFSCIKKKGSRRSFCDL
jgi:curved DNA-binding protein